MAALSVNCPDCGAVVELTVQIAEVTPERDMGNHIQWVTGTASGIGTHRCAS